MEWKGASEAEAWMGWKESQGLESCCLQEGLWALVTVGISATPSEGCASLKGASTGVGQCLAGGGTGEVLMVRANHPHSQTGASPSASQECAALGASAPSGRRQRVRGS